MEAEQGRGFLEWLPVIISFISAAGAIGAALVAGRHAARTKLLELQAERIRDLEKRLASQRDEIYGPMVELFREVFDAPVAGKGISESRVIKTLSKFSAWVQVYGSDDTVRCFHKFMQAVYTDPPPEIPIRLYADFVLAMRRDLGDPTTTTTPVDLLGMRIRDIYSSDMGRLMLLPETDLYKAKQWRPPWGKRFGNEGQP